MKSLEFPIPSEFAPRLQVQDALIQTSWHPPTDYNPAYMRARGYINGKLFMEMKYGFRIEADLMENHAKTCQAIAELMKFQNIHSFTGSKFKGGDSVIWIQQ